MELFIVCIIKILGRNRFCLKKAVKECRRVIVLNKGVIIIHVKYHWQFPCSFFELFIKCYCIIISRCWSIITCIRITYSDPRCICCGYMAVKNVLNIKFSVIIDIGINSSFLDCFLQKRIIQMKINSTAIQRKNIVNAEIITVIWRTMRYSKHIIISFICCSIKNRQVYAAV